MRTGRALLCRQIAVLSDEPCSHSPAWRRGAEVSGMDAKMRRRRRRPRKQAASEHESPSRDIRYQQEQPEEEVKFGCVALGKVRYRIRDPRARVPGRCALGFALRSDDDVCKCLAVTGPSECWKELDGVHLVKHEPASEDAPSAEAAD